MLGADGTRPSRLLATGAGTSYAAPLVTHIAARVLGQDPTLSANAVRALVLSSAAPLNIFTGPPSAATRTKAEQLVGYGRPDVAPGGELHRPPGRAPRRRPDGPVAQLSSPHPATDTGTLAAQVEAVLVASRVLVGVSAQSIAATEDLITMPQWRAMVIIASAEPITLGQFAEHLGVHPSNATRTCDRLVAVGFVDRRDDPADRRQLSLSLTRAGHDLVESVLDQRRAAITKVLRRMPADTREALAPVLQSFGEAAGETPISHLWAMGWTA